LYYTGFSLFFAALQRAGTVEDTNAVRLAMEQIKEYDGLLGKVRWSGKESYGINHQLTGPAFIGQIIGGKAKVIATIDIK
jgi:branched-chain amino acid transport system substrate-binding protein